LIGVNFESNADDGYVIIKSDDNFWHMYFLQIRGRYIYATSSADVSRELELMGGKAHSDASDADLGSWGSI
jgi:hypothetical protein